MLLDMSHMTRGKHTWEIWGLVENPKHVGVWCPHSRGTNTETLKQQWSTREGDQKLV
jgi:hypothetical protein